MIKVVAGEYGSRNLKTLQGDNTRPTSVKVRSAIFNRIGPYFSKGIVLDLFSGSGAFGIECLSRGFNEAYFIDNNVEAIKIIKENCLMIKNKDINIIKSDYKNALNKLNDIKFDCVFLDPPYKMKVIDEILNYLVLNDMLNYNCDVICETLKEDILVDNINDLYKIKEVVYGMSKITYYSRRER